MGPGSRCVLELARPSSREPTIHQGSLILAIHSESIHATEIGECNISGSPLLPKSWLLSIPQHRH